MIIQKSFCCYLCITDSYHVKIQLHILKVLLRIPINWVLSIASGSKLKDLKSLSKHASENTPQKMKFSLRFSSVNVTKFVENCGFGHITEQILNGKLYFLCSGLRIIFNKHSIYDETLISRHRIIIWIKFKKLLEKTELRFNFNANIYRYIDI